MRLVRPGPPGHPAGGSSGRVGTWLVVLAGVWALVGFLNRALRDVTGPSMLPTLRPGDRILVLPVPPRLLRRGDVVVVRDPRRPDRETVKRVAGLPGQRIRPPPAPPTRPTTRDAVIDVPEGHLLVLGDNPALSTDSRAFGPVPTSHLVGRVVARLTPPGVVARRPAGPTPRGRP